jgi:hypothetical protein
MTVVPPPERVNTMGPDTHRRWVAYLRELPAIIRALATLLVAIGTVLAVWIK